jgi:hypothetical protein
MTRQTIRHAAWLIAFLAAVSAAGWALRGLQAAQAKLSSDKALNTLTEEERKAGWKLLFDGKTAKGWRKFKGKEMPGSWQVKDGVLALIPGSGKSGGDIVTDGRYDSFDLVLEWKIAPGGNSGVMYHVIEDDLQTPWQSGPEYQLLDNGRHPDGKSPLTSAASCYALYAPAKDVTRPVGEWNKTRIVVRGPHVEHWLNGKKVVEFELGSADWVKRVKESKFRDMPKFGKARKGHICLQDHGDRVEFRNIKVRELKEEK